MNHRIISIGALCVMLGASFGIATSSAATSKTSKAKKATATAAATGGQQRPPHAHGPGGPGGQRGGIHSESVVPDSDGSGFVTVTSDNGSITAIDGSVLTIKEGTATETWKTVTVTVRDGASIVRNGTTATLADLKVGDNVHVSDDGAKSTVFAGTAAWEAANVGRGHRGPGGPGGGQR